MFLFVTLDQGSAAKHRMAAGGKENKNNLLSEFLLLTTALTGYLKYDWYPPWTSPNVDAL